MTGHGMTANTVLLDWRHATTGLPAPCVLCGKPALLRSPGKKVPCHKTCAEDWITTHSHDKQAQLAA